MDSDGILYGVSVDRSEADTSGISVAFVARLPHWAAVNGQAEAILKADLRRAMEAVLHKIINSPASQDQRRELTATPKRPK